MARRAAKKNAKQDRVQNANKPAGKKPTNGRKRIKNDGSGGVEMRKKIDGSGAVEMRKRGVDQSGTVEI